MEDIFANLGQIRENIFGEIKVKLRIRENIFREIFSKMCFFQNTRKFSTVEKISLFFSENMRSSIITTINREIIFHDKLTFSSNFAEISSAKLTFYP